MKRTDFDFGLITHWLRELAGAALVAAIVLATRGYVHADDTPSSKTPTAWLRVTDPPGLNSASRDHRQDYEGFRKTQAYFLHSPNIIQVAIDNSLKDLPLVKQQRDPQQWLEDHIKVVVPPESELIQVSVPGEDPAQAAKIVNAIVDAYMQKIIGTERAEVLRLRGVLEVTIKEKANELARMQQLVTEMSRRTAGGPMGRDLVRERISNLQRLITTVRERKLDNDLRIAAAKARITNLPSDSPDSPAAKQAKLDLAVAEAEHEVLLSTREEVTKELQQFVADLTSGDEDSSGLKELQVRIREVESARSQLVQQLDSLSIKLQMPERVIVVDPAH